MQFKIFWSCECRRHHEENIRQITFMTGQKRWKLVWVHGHMWLYEFCLNCGEMKAFWFRWRHSMFLQMNSACPSSDIPTTFFLVKHWSWPEMWTVSLLPTHLLVPYIFLSLFKHFLNVALSLWLNMHSNHSAMQKHNEGLSIWKTNSFTWWLFCFGIALLSSQLLRNKIKNW